MSEFQLPYKAISHAEFETVKEKLNQVAYSIGQPLNADTLFFKAPFEEVPELFVGRRVFLQKGFAYVTMHQAVDSSGNAAKAGLRAGDQVLYTSSFFGDELWPVDKLGFTKTVIQAKPDSVYFVVNRGAEFTNLKYFRVEIDEVRWNPAECEFCKSVNAYLNSWNQILLDMFDLEAELNCLIDPDLTSLEFTRFLDKKLDTQPGNKLETETEQKFQLEFWIVIAVRKSKIQDEIFVPLTSLCQRSGNSGLNFSQCEAQGISVAKCCSAEAVKEFLKLKLEDDDELTEFCLYGQMNLRLISEMEIQETTIAESALESANDKSRNEQNFCSVD
ncbi:hypothetical protein ZIOFF_017214 [Zingiber officinale]|uniref:Uncharacterized protein n=1 Tax=Zingiber officinale TaxID=94328 RepID=A0A8J5HRK8_ZINOF|nr:hypothetical protein ZIOFF_017214 [Zingiber officinale]